MVFPGLKLADKKYPTMGQFYNTQGHALILCDSFESPPGCTVPWLLLNKANDRVLSACVRMNKGSLYIKFKVERGHMFFN